MKRINISLLILFTIFSFFNCQPSKDKKLLENEMAQMVLEKFDAEDPLKRDTCLRALAEFLNKESMEKYPVLRAVVASKLLHYHTVFIYEYQECYHNILKKKVDAVYQDFAKVTYKNSDMDIYYRNTEIYHRNKADTIFYYLTVAYEKQQINLQNLLDYKTAMGMQFRLLNLKNQWRDDLSRDANISEVCGKWKGYYLSLDKYSDIFFSPLLYYVYKCHCVDFNPQPANSTYNYFIQSIK